mmetsp:Transcript_12073/g.20199  ORF Transcript_12073/g.20199 Transcript_12073/m.20199 type:complete len:224 (-) Transcript_12073:46-717(-)|eukprot:CAMPEP_0168589144 /NCGR_PEP_ID=MMETSP0420-20121227/5856_1 /TAXON_ID=498008 /ORGANISM="Pessonella sp." /LENGTH=223 /DNA_ID=CAMNT_0008624673 /DNA_START=59 /DNA_END=730 /DNA_ORIENTATION=+
MLTTVVLISLAVTLISASSSSSSSSSNGGLRHVGTKISRSSLVKYGSSFYFWDKQLEGTFQHVSATCGSLYVENDSSEEAFETDNNGWRVCHDAEYIAINAYQQAQATSLDGLYFTGLVESLQKYTSPRNRRSYGSIDFIAFNEGVWQTVAGHRLSKPIAQDQDSIEVQEIAYYGQLAVGERPGHERADQYVLKAYCCVGPQAKGVGNDNFLNAPFQYQLFTK